MFFTQDFVTQNLWNRLRSHSNIRVYHIRLLPAAVKKLDLADKHMVLLTPWVASTPYFGIKFLVSLDVRFFSPFFISVLLPFFPPYTLSLHMDFKNPCNSSAMVAHTCNSSDLEELCSRTNSRTVYASQRYLVPKYIQKIGFSLSWACIGLVHAITTAVSSCGQPLSLHRSCACSHNYHEFIWATTMLYPENNFFCSHLTILTLRRSLNLEWRI